MYRTKSVDPITPTVSWKRQWHLWVPLRITEKHLFVTDNARKAITENLSARLGELELIINK